MTNRELLLMLVPAASALLGAATVGVLAFFTQYYIREDERASRKDQRMRDAYANWAGAILAELHAWKLTIVSDAMGREKMPEEFKPIMNSHFMEVNRAWHDAFGSELIQFARLHIIDDDKKRLREVQEIRSLVKDVPIEARATAESMEEWHMLAEKEAVERLFTLLRELGVYLDA